MTRLRQLSPDDLEPGLSTAEQAQLVEMAERLISERPAPRAAFRAQLRADLRDLTEGNSLRSRPSWLWRRVALLAGSGTGILGLVGLGLVRIGPFGP